MLQHNKTNPPPHASLVQVSDFSQTPVLRPQHSSMPAPCQYYLIQSQGNPLNGVAGCKFPYPGPTE